MRWPVSLNFQAKVLLPVMSIMVLLVVLPMGIVSRRMSHQLEKNAADSLATADAVFRRLQGLRANSLLLRYRNVPNEPRCKAVLKLADAKTLSVLLRELLDELDADVAVFSGSGPHPLAHASRRGRLDAEEFTERSKDPVQRAMAGQPNLRTISADGRLYDVVSIPAAMGEDVFGALTFANELADEVVQEFKQITRSEILLLVDGEIAAATLSAADLSGELHHSLFEIVRSPAAAQGRRSWRPGTVLINGEHFMGVARQLDDEQSGPKLQYVLLSSYEKPLQALQSTQRMFLWWQLAGILLGGALVWWLVRRVTRPLRELRKSAEAVGQGDFSRRVDIRSLDECGQLASVFNRMTTNLQSSRQELEKTVETLRSTQAQLVQSEKLRAIGTLAGGIAHDFNNILGAILGFGELALEDVPGESRTARNLRQVLKAGQRAKELVRQILAFSRQNEPQRVSIRLSAIVDETLKLLRASIPSTVEIRHQIRTRADTVVADPTQMHQVLMNLGTNASHAMRERGGSLTFTLDDCVLANGTPGAGPNLPPGPYLRLAVTDTGHGMTQDIVERIFEPFFTTKPVGEGTGLGLSVVHGIIKSHGGEITVSSTPDVGTTFTLFLPRVEAQEPQPTAAEGALPGKSERILVVDDEECLANMMQQKLTRLGYDVVAHRDSLAAWKEFEAAPRRFDVVITDQTMPHLTGNDLARRISRLRPETPVILCSGSGQALLSAQERCSAVRQCLPKPVNFVELSRSLRQVLDVPS